MEKEVLFTESDNGIIAAAPMMYAEFLNKAIEECEPLGIDLTAQQRFVDRVNELQHKFRNKSDEE